MGNVIGGTLRFTAGGVQYSVEGAWKSAPHNTSFEETVGPDGGVHLIEKPMAPFFEGNVKNVAGTLKALRSARDVEATLELANGELHVYEGATQVNQLVTDTQAATIPVKFVATSSEVV